MRSVNWSKIVLEKGVSKLEEIPRRPLPHIAVVGKSNSGKSSLINHVASRKHLAKTSKTAGKTRRLDFYLIPDQFYLVDLPGYGYARVGASLKKKWSELLDEYMQSDFLSAVVFLVDGRHDPTREDLQFWQWAKTRGLPLLVVLTKWDKVKNVDRSSRLKKTAEILGCNPEAIISYTIESGASRDDLGHAIEELLWA